MEEQWCGELKAAAVLAVAALGEGLKGGVSEGVKDDDDVGKE